MIFRKREVTGHRGIGRRAAESLGRCGRGSAQNWIRIPRKGGRDPLTPGTVPVSQRVDRLNIPANGFLIPRYSTKASGSSGRDFEDHSHAIRAAKVCGAVEIAALIQDQVTENIQAVCTSRKRVELGISP